MDMAEDLFYRQTASPSPIHPMAAMTADQLEAQIDDVMKHDPQAEKHRLEKQIAFKKRSIKTMKRRMIRASGSSRTEMQQKIQETKKSIAQLKLEIQSIPGLKTNGLSSSS